MALTTIKISDTVMEIVKTETVETRRKMSYGDLLQQRINVQAQKDSDNIQRDEELAELDTLIAEAEKLGLKLPTV